MDFLPFARPSLDADDFAAITRVLASGWLASGPEVEAFEAELSAALCTAQFTAGPTVRAFSSATATLEVALRVAGVGPGDEVIVPAMSFAATANVVVRVGARPVFVDVDLETRNLDLGRAAAAITPRTRALLPVHFAGLPLDLDALHGLARRHGLRVIEDAAHAVGARWRGRPVGGEGDLVVFSFHPNKNMTAVEGGALCFAGPADPAQVRAAERLRFHGIERGVGGAGADGMDVSVAGGKFNLPDLHAALGRSQLARLEGFNARRRALAGLYRTHWPAQVPALLPADADGHAWHLYAPLLAFRRADTPAGAAAEHGPAGHGLDPGRARVPALGSVPGPGTGSLRLTRAGFIAAMKARGVGVGVHYPALHLFSLYRGLGYREGDFPNAERIGAETVTLPLYPSLQDADVARVCAAVAGVLAE